jgi:4-hydroxy-2-oxoheptanedioate aldolase
VGKVKEKLARGEVVLKVSPRYRAPRLVEYIGSLGFDAVFLDQEHGKLTLDELEDMARAARVAGLSAIGRPEANERHMILHLLDVDGVEGIMCSHTSTADDCKRIVEWASYGRYRDPSYLDTGMWGLSDRLIIPIIETPEGIKNLPEMLKVEGIDLVFIGPNDLSQGLGLPGQLNHPDVVKAREYATKTILDAGKHVGTLATYDNIGSLIDAGVRYFVISANAFMSRGAKEFKGLVNQAIDRQSSKQPVTS